MLSGEVRIDAPDEDRKQQYEQIVKDGKYGTIHKTSGKPGLPLIYTGLVFLSDGMVEIKSGENRGLARIDGKVLVAPKYGYLSQQKNVKGKSFYVVGKDSKYGLLDDGFQEATPLKYDYITSCYECDRSGNLLLVTNAKKSGLIDKKGKVVVEPAYDYIQSLGSLLKVKRGKYFGLIDSMGQVKLEPKYHAIEMISNTLFKFVEGDVNIKYGLIDSKGSVMLNPVYDYIHDFEGGFAQVSLNKKYGLINKRGEFVLQPQYDYLIPKINAGIIASKNGTAGLLKMNGDVLIPFNYKKLSFVGNEVYFENSGQKGVMSTSGKLLSNLNYDDVVPSERYLVVKKEGKFGVLDSRLKTVFPIKYDSFKNSNSSQFLKDGTALATINGSSYMMDRYGNELSEQELESFKRDRSGSKPTPAVPKGYRENLIYTLSHVDVAPTFTKGIPFKKFISDNLKLTERSRNVKGDLFVGFVIEKDGSIGEVTFQNRLGAECESEMIRVIKSSPKWKPAIKDGVPVRVNYQIIYPINK